MVQNLLIHMLSMRTTNLYITYYYTDIQCAYTDYTTLSLLFMSYIILL